MIRLVSGFRSRLNSLGCVERVSSPNHIFFSWKSLTKQFTSTLRTMFPCNWQQPFLNQQKEENDRRNYFMISLHESMGPGWDQTLDLWICSPMISISCRKYLE